MELYLAVPFGTLGLFIAASGVATVARGWMLPMHRRYVRRPRLFGWGQLVLSFAMFWQAAVVLVIGTANRGWWALAGNALIFVSIAMIGLSQRGERRDQEQSTAS
ncbi:hypothetical protein ACWCPM_21265 [Streptomyces sp. NPDC002309]